MRSTLSQKYPDSHATSEFQFSLCLCLPVACALHAPTLSCNDWRPSAVETVDRLYDFQPSRHDLVPRIKYDIYGADSFGAAMVVLILVGRVMFSPVLRMLIYAHHCSSFVHHMDGYSGFRNRLANIATFVWGWIRIGCVWVRRPTPVQRLRT